QRPDPTSRPEYRYGEPSGRPARHADRGYGYESGSGYRDRTGYGEQATVLPEPYYQAHGLAARAELPADPPYATSPGYAAGPGTATSPGYAASSGYLDTGFSQFR